MHRIMALSRYHMVMLGLATLASLVSFVVVASAQDEPVQSEDVQIEVVDGDLVLAEAIFAGGCFWCVESDFDKVVGVVETTSGYTGGTVDAPTYRQVSKENTGHYEAVKISYDPSQVSYAELVEYFWRHVDPTDDGGQFCDRGSSYRTAIFTASDEERRIAEASKSTIEQSNVLSAPIVTPIIDATIFWGAEEYHQDYYLKNPVRYQFYRNGCRRDDVISRVWARENAEG
ncbi:MAG: peptide-methionine (S)-S-oxide reductase MsrA [Pseudomonadota bacterium]